VLAYLILSLKYFYIPFKIFYTITGLILSGIGFALLFYPIMPEMQHIAQKLNIGDRTKVFFIQIKGK
jgi:hypothetical protein